MTEVLLARARIVPGQENALREWFGELAQRENEVIETLQHEGVYTETAFIDDASEPSFLYVLMEAIDIGRASAAGDAEVHRIDAEHHDVLESALTGEWEPLETIGHFTNPDLRQRR
ncbi:MAG: DUF6176 family protein [Halobacteriaceae archaeon]